MKKSVAPVWLGAAAMCALWPAVSVGQGDLATAKAAPVSQVVASGAMDSTELLGAEKGEKKEGKAVATASVKAASDTSGKKVVDSQATSNAKTPAEQVEELPTSVAKRVDDFSVEVIDPDLRRTTAGNGTGMQILHAESHYATDIPDENEPLKVQKVTKSAAPAERSRRKVVTGAQQELQVAISAFGFVAKDQERRNQEAEALMQAENLRAKEEAEKREAEAKKQAEELALKAQEEKATEKPAEKLSEGGNSALSVVAEVVADKTEGLEIAKLDGSKPDDLKPNDLKNVATEIVEATDAKAKKELADASDKVKEATSKKLDEVAKVADATIASTGEKIKEANKEANKVLKENEVAAKVKETKIALEPKPETKPDSESKSKTKTEPEVVAKADNAKASQDKNAKDKVITVAELERLFPMPKAPKEEAVSTIPSKVDLKANAGTYHVDPGIGTYRLSVELYKSDEGYTQDQFLTALFRRNPDKFGPRGPLYPYEGVDLVLPTKEQIKLEKNGTFANYLSRPGERLLVQNLPTLGASNGVSDGHKKYLEACRNIERKRSEYLAAKGLTIENHKNK